MLMALNVLFDLTTFKAGLNACKKRKKRRKEMSINSSYVPKTITCWSKNSDDACLKFRDKSLSLFHIFFTLSTFTVYMIAKSIVVKKL